MGLGWTSKSNSRSCEITQTKKKQLMYFETKMVHVWSTNNSHSQNTPWCGVGKDLSVSFLWYTLRFLEGATSRYHFFVRSFSGFIIILFLTPIGKFAKNKSHIPWKGLPKGISNFQIKVNLIFYCANEW
jgi:hypothetical protein